MAIIAGSDGSRVLPRFEPGWLDNVFSDAFRDICGDDEGDSVFVIGAGAGAGAGVAFPTGAPPKAKDPNDMLANRAAIASSSA